MKAFIVLALFATGTLAAFTYHPIQVCTPASQSVHVSRDGSYYTATTTITNPPVCYWRH